MDIYAHRITRPGILNVPRARPRVIGRMDRCHGRLSAWSSSRSPWGNTALSGAMLLFALRCLDAPPLRLGHAGHFVSIALILALLVGVPR
jgi:hypothetical protein